MLVQVFLSIDLRWRDSELLKAGYWLCWARSAHDRFGLTHSPSYARYVPLATGRDVGCAIVMISLALMSRAILGLRVRPHFSRRREACSIRRAAVECNSLTSARNPSNVGLVCATVFIMAHGGCKGEAP